MRDARILYKTNIVGRTIIVYRTQIYVQLTNIVKCMHLFPYSNVTSTEIGHGPQIITFHVVTTT